MIVFNTVFLHFVVLPVKDLVGRCCKRHCQKRSVDGTNTKVAVNTSNLLVALKKQGLNRGGMRVCGLFKNKSHWAQQLVFQCGFSNRICQVQSRVLRPDQGRLWSDLCVAVWTQSWPRSDGLAHITYATRHIGSQCRLDPIWEHPHLTVIASWSGTRSQKSRWSTKCNRVWHVALPTPYLSGKLKLLKVKLNVFFI